MDGNKIAHLKPSLVFYDKILRILFSQHIRSPVLWFMGYCTIFIDLPHDLSAAIFRFFWLLEPKIKILNQIDFLLGF